MVETNTRQRCVPVLCLLLCCVLVLAGCQPGDSSAPGSNETTAVVPPSGSPVPAGLTDTPVQFRTIPVAVRAATSSVEADPLDWTYCRGPEFNGVSRETGLVDNWDPNGGDGSNVAWKRADLGGRSTPVVMHGKLFTLVRAEPGTPREGEKVVCIDAETGETIWENRFNVYLSDVPDSRVGWSSVVADPETGRVYALGVCGLFMCLDAETGETIWSIPLHERFGLLSTYGGRTNFPVLCDDLVIISGVIIGWGDRARPEHCFIGFDKLSGDVVWFEGTTPLPEDTTYSIPSLTVLNGQKALVFGAGDGKVWAIQPRTGQPIWEFPFSRRGLNAPIVVANGVVYTGNREENIVGTSMGALVAIDGASGKELWRIDEMLAGRAAPIPIGDQLWVIDDGAKLHVLDVKTGEPVARKIPLSTVMQAAPLYADGKVYALAENGKWFILQPDPRRGAKIVSRGQLPSGEAVYASPICSHGRIYIQSTGGLYCLYDANKQPGSVPLPPAPEEADVSSDSKPAHLQIVPAEVLMRPGQTQKFTARLFNSRGQFLEAVNAQFSLDGPGQISSDGEFVAPGEGHVAAILKASAAGLTGKARIRVVPSLPWHFDFENARIDPKTKTGEPPVTWVGARYRHVVREMDGNKVMVKITTIPKGTRSRCWFGHSDLHDYTIQADVRGAAKDGKMPDIGLIAQGYTLDLQGASQALQIRSWVPQELRSSRTVEFPWQADQWYTMKLRASVEDGRAILKGKVWPRGSSEPSEWTVEVIDEAPNLSGSPGLYGNAKDAEIYLDNLQVTAN